MPMDEGGNDWRKGSSDPVTKGSLHLNDNDSGDDLAWADFCLTKLSEASDADWSSFEESLLEILNGPTEPVSLLADENGNHDYAEFGDDQTMKTPMLSDDDSDFADKDDEDSQDDAVDDIIRKKKKKWLKGNIVSDESPLLSDHAEFLKAETSDSESGYSSSAFKLEVEGSDSGFDFGSASFENETASSEDIFKVWDLGVSDEQDEFTKKLNEALEQSTIASTASVTEGRLDFVVQSVDDLIAGISELSLGQSSF